MPKNKITDLSEAAPFSYKEWMSDCNVTHLEASEILNIPVSLSQCFSIGSVPIPQQTIERCLEQKQFTLTSLESSRAQLMPDKYNNNFNQSLQSLRSCLNSLVAGAKFWENNHQTRSDSIDADLIGFKTVSIKQKKEQNRSVFQPYETIQEKKIASLVVIDFFPYFDKEPMRESSFIEFLRNSKDLEVKRKALEGSGICYICDYDIDNIVDKVRGL